MAPVKIKYVVSFTFQDPKSPVENLLLEEGVRPWLSSPQDRSRQLKAELQLEHASRIGYIDVGNCGSAFLQIDVGRSSWPLDQSYLTLLPTTALMMPADAKLDKNRSAVRMFKEGDFLASALGEKWDRIRLTCSQPFNKRTQFGLSFIRIRTPQDVDDSKSGPVSVPSQAPSEPSSSPWLSNAAFCRTFFPEAPSSTEQEAALKSRLQQLDPASSPGTCMSRPARMVLQGACARKRAFPLVPGPTPPSAESKEDGQSQQEAQEPVVSRPKQESSARRGGTKTSRRRASCSNLTSSAAASSVKRRGNSRRERRNPGQQGRLRNMEREEEEKEEEERWPRKREVELGVCPICAGHFPTNLLPAHASSCGEEDFEARSSSSSPSSWEELVADCVHCPICQFRFPAAEIERHASNCGEPTEALVNGPSWLWAEQGE
uniref:XRCC1 N-terminal domain containing 1, N-terminal like n=1 Tax=Podarcis muralis TaxID=64176 RepID=A0A670HQ12_PODMU|nr:short transient receptor potential channel 2-like isoform X2 [Podarcis muralis]